MESGEGEGGGDGQDWGQVMGQQRALIYRDHPRLVESLVIWTHLQLGAAPTG